MRHKRLVPTVQKWLKSVQIYRSYRKIKLNQIKLNKAEGPDGGH